MASSKPLILVEADPIECGKGSMIAAVKVLMVIVDAESMMVGEAESTMVGDAVSTMRCRRWLVKRSR
jgi:hypothetical protein